MDAISGRIAAQYVILQLPTSRQEEIYDRNYRCAR
jgi:hypothetical protein